ncbi:MAG: AMP-binding enzyme [Acidimicrobiales bacterium]
MFITGGFNAYPAEIEAVLLGHPDVAQAAVVGVPDDFMGEGGVASVVPRLNASVDADEVLHWAWERLAKYKLSRLELIDALPLIASGKVMQFKLRERVAGASVEEPS